MVQTLIYLALGFVLRQGLIVLTIVNILVEMAYYGILEGGARGQTLGKRALRIRVVDFPTGGAIGFGRGVLRYFARYLSGIPLGLGYLWMLQEREKRTWHDKLVGTVVVPVDAYPVRATDSGAGADGAAATPPTQR